MMYRTVTVTPTLTDSIISVTPTLAESIISVNADMATKIRYYAEDVEDYVGAYEWTPTQETQTINIANKMATADIIINPIPENYGLISWDGSVLTVS